jgi:hypothetical protein
MKVTMIIGCLSHPGYTFNTTPSTGQTTQAKQHNTIDWPNATVYLFARLRQLRRADFAYDVHRKRSVLF